MATINSIFSSPFKRGFSGPLNLPPPTTGGWSIADFMASDFGDAFDFTTNSNLYQDVLKSTSVGALGDPVGNAIGVVNAFELDNHLTASRPIWVQGATRPGIRVHTAGTPLWIVRDDTETRQMGDTPLVAASVTFDAQPESNGSFIWCGDTNPTTNTVSRFGIYHANAGFPLFAYSQLATTGNISGPVTKGAQGTEDSFIAYHDSSNNVGILTPTQTSTLGTDTGNIGGCNDGLWIGRLNNSSALSSGAIVHRAVFLARDFSTISAEDISNLFAWLGGSA